LEAAQTKREARRDRLRATSLRNLVAPDESKEHARFLLRHSPRMITKPEHVAGVRQAILDLAVRGQLVPESAEIEPSLSILPGQLGADPRNFAAPWVVPNHWHLVTLTDLAGHLGVFVDGDWVESKDQDAAGEVRLTQLADVGAGHFRDRSSRFMRKDVAERLRCTFLSAGDVLIARMPDPLGRACTFPGDRRPCVTVVDVAILRTKRADVDPRYVVHALNSSLFGALVQAKASGTTRQRISRGNLGRLPFPLPPLAEQHRIVAKVNELMAVCDELGQSLATEQTEQARLLEALLHDALEDALPAPELEPLGAR